MIILKWVRYGEMINTTRAKAGERFEIYEAKDILFDKYRCNLASSGDVPWDANQQYR